jgi:P27 family predicted phage terminase small subunit
MLPLNSWRAGGTSKKFNRARKKTARPVSREWPQVRRFSRSRVGPESAKNGRRQPEATMSGPPPQPAYLRLLKGNPGKRAVKQEPQPGVLAELPQPPAFLSEDAREEWRRIIEQMVRLRLVTGVDTTLFACYCQSFAHWKAAVEALNRMSERDPVTGGLLIKDQRGDARVNPMTRVVRGAAETMMHLASQFGLTPIARARIASAGFEPAPGGGKFDGLIA